MPTAAPSPSHAAGSTSPAAGTTTWVLVTNPSHFPSSHWWWVACQLCEGTFGRWTVEVR